MGASEKIENQIQMLSGFPGWKLEDAKARFSELVKSAKLGPQRVTVHGRDAVMVVDAQIFAKLLPSSTQPNLFDLLSDSPLAGLDFGRKGVRSPVRKVEL